MEAKPKYIPTPDEIRDGCAEIQNGWDAKHERSRRVEKPKRWTVPVVQWDDVSAAWVDVESDGSEA